VLLIGAILNHSQDSSGPIFSRCSNGRMKKRKKTLRLQIRVVRIVASGAYRFLSLSTKKGFSPR
jgi:hypothetical protein